MTALRVPAAQVYAEVIGDPVAQSKSPAIHRFWLGRLGLAGDYRATRVGADELRDFLTTRRADPAWRGCNVTMPHKQAVMALLDRLDPLAAHVGAVNTIVPEQGALVGYNTDVPGFLEPLRAALDAPQRFRMACVLGTGGAARAVVAALAGQGMAIVVAGRDAGKARVLLDALAPGGGHHAVSLAHCMAPGGSAGDCDLVVNATSLGMAGHDPLCFDVRHAPPGAVFYDIVTSPLDTAWLRAARAAGFATIDGLAMLIGQADHAFRRFFGATPPRDGDDARLRAMLGA